MLDKLSSKYKTYSQIAINKSTKGWSWEEIKMLRTPNDDLLQKMLDGFAAMNDVEITVEEWKEIVDEEQKNQEMVEIVIVSTTVIPADQDYEYVLDTNRGSAWYSYKKKLMENHFDIEDINSIESSCCKILNNLSLDTTKKEAVKGLVVGNVQSGKTANMAALMAMAADQGWNLFIVLSGTIENLRKQTQERLINDLNSATNVAWVPINNVSTASTDPQALSKLTLSNNAKQRYLMVCLKNSKRLRNLLVWMKKDKNRENLKVIIIDDEADQAGVNTYKAGVISSFDPEDEERTTINREIVYLLNNKDEEGKEARYKTKAVNYVAYTATPYANVLNEKPGPNSTYPSNFVASLGANNKYFGPQKIFGLASEGIDGLDIINTIPKEELDEVKKIEKCASILPKELENAVLWFYCCLATKRFQKSTDPVSMLIHTSQKQAEHDLLAKSIQRWFCSFGDGIDFLKKCEEVFDKQTSKFTLDDFKKGYSDYGRNPVNDYPKFEQISNYLIELYNNKIKSIQIDQDGEFTYHKGVHLCIDNCSHNGVENDNEHIRLIYPKKKSMDYATGFIVVGGATLSRGLTIEGLVSTYFLRTVKQADTLMQMGRWFGYRQGYELLQRIWLTDDTKEKFEFLSELDVELRQKMKYMEERKIMPATVGISIMDFASKRFEVTARNKMKAASVVEMDFSGLISQTTMFLEAEEDQKNNIDEAGNFIGLLDEKYTASSGVNQKEGVLWRNVDSIDVIEFIEKLKYPKADTNFINVKLFGKWYDDLRKKGKLDNWNVYFSGVSTSPKVFLGARDINTVTRSRKVYDVDDGIIRIAVLRASQDLYADVDFNSIKFDEVDKKAIKNGSSSEIVDIRKKAGLGKTPLLIVYIIDKNSQPKPGAVNRVQMNTKYDLVGITVVIPGCENNSNNRAHLGIDMNSITYEGEEN